MSSPLAIAAVTATLRSLLAPAEAHVTTLALDLARPNGGGPDSGNQINLFLYQITPNAALRNMDPPSQVRPGERGRPPLAINLHYLLTTYASDELDAQELLGRALSILHDHPVLDRTLIENATTNLAGNRLAGQFERVRLVFQSLSLEDLSKLWSGFQAHFRLSAAFEASVVLIDSGEQPPAALPVLTRGPRDQGADVFGSARPPGPALTGVRGLFGEPQVEPPGEEPPPGEVTRPGEVTLEGYELDRFGPPTVVLEMPGALRDLLPDQVQIQPTSFTSDKVIFTMPKRDDLPVGIYMVSVSCEKDGRTVTSNRVPLTLLPLITLKPLQVARDVTGDITVKITAHPAVLLRRQTVVLLLGGRPVPMVIPSPGAGESATDLTFKITKVEQGQYWVRLRVDGIDSALVQRDQKPPAFNKKYLLTVTNA